MEDRKLRIIDFDGNNLSLVPTENLVSGILGLEELALSNFLESNLTTEQLTVIFTELSTLKDHKLKILRLSEMDLSVVPTVTLLGGISSLEEVDLTRTNLTREQLTGIYGMVAERKCSRLRKIDVKWNDNLCCISADLRARANLNQSVEIVTCY